MPAMRGRESDSGDDDGGSEKAGEEESEEQASEGATFTSDRERYQAVINAARKHGLGLDDLEELERSESVEEVERRARGMAERRTLNRRVEALEKRLAPVQQFDSNRPSAPSSGSDEAWIDRYMAGDRSARAVAARRDGHSISRESHTGRKENTCHRQRVRETWRTPRGRSSGRCCTRRSTTRPRWPW